MSTLLYVDASPRGAQSHSRRAAAEFLDHVRAHEPDVTIEHLAIWHEALPDLAGATLSAKYARLANRPHTAQEAAAWDAIVRLVDMLARADRILIATPMWNLSIPYRLKHWIDLVTQPGLSFRFDPASGYHPLLASKPVVVIMASAGDFSGGHNWGRPDLATPYLRQALAFIGLADVRFVAVAPTAGPPEQIALGAETSARALAQQARDLAGIA